MVSENPSNRDSNTAMERFEICLLALERPHFGFPLKFGLVSYSNWPTAEPALRFTTAGRSASQGCSNHSLDSDMIVFAIVRPRSLVSRIRVTGSSEPPLKRCHWIRLVIRSPRFEISPPPRLPFACRGACAGRFFSFLSYRDPLSLTSFLNPALSFRSLPHSACPPCSLTRLFHSSYLLSSTSLPRYRLPSPRSRRLPPTLLLGAAWSSLQMPLHLGGFLLPPLIPSLPPRYPSFGLGSPALSFDTLVGLARRRGYRRSGTPGSAPACLNTPLPLAEIPVLAVLEPRRDGPRASQPPPRPRACLSSRSPVPVGPLPGSWLGCRDPFSWASFQARRMLPPKSLASPADWWRFSKLKSSPPPVSRFTPLAWMQKTLMMIPLGWCSHINIGIYRLGGRLHALLQCAVEPAVGLFNSHECGIVRIPYKDAGISLGVLLLVTTFPYFCCDPSLDDLMLDGQVMLHCTGFHIVWGYVDWCYLWGCPTHYEGLHLRLVMQLLIVSPQCVFGRILHADVSIARAKQPMVVIGR
ncbi:hypothetical protein Nepgr_033975 [Nepenthes gracilis]|uniref:Uncharacterized protein n=1 Tax=Nepenthes gracilis TaxID=150966 RepID=A0AAD3Y978_NEPGR|nr:hypothetical protein Nepgr_033975 [Nepenthes gracilis]